MRHTPSLVGLIFLSSVSQPLLANEHDHQQLGAHQHGAAELNLVVEGEEVLIELLTPADNLLGFEHQARTEADKQKLEQTVSRLRQGAIIQLTAAADCELEAVEIESALIEDHDSHNDDHKEHEDHEHHDDHDEHEKQAEHDDHEDHDSAHSEFHVSYHYHCHKPDALSGADVQLWQQFEGFEQIQVQLISPKGQQRLELTRSHPHIRF